MALRSPRVSDPMPGLQLHMPSDNSVLKAHDERLNRVLNQVEQHFCSKTTGLLRFENLYTKENSLITELPALDHYGQREEGWHYLYQAKKPDTQPGDLSGIGEENKPTLFFYLDSRIEHLVEMLKGLSKEFEMFGHLGYLSDKSLIEQLRKYGIKVFPSLLNIEQAMAHAEVVKCNAGSGMLNNIVEYKKPAIIMPLQLEQTMAAFQLYSRKAAWVLNPQQGVQQLHAGVATFISQLPELKAKLDKLNEEQLHHPGLWQGNLATDFLFTSN